MSRVFITGGSGFIGTNLIESFLEDGWEIVNYDISAPRNREHLPLHVQGDIRNEGSLYRSIRDFGPVLVIHLAARTDLDGTSLADYDVNSVGTNIVLNAVRTSRTVSRLVVSSSRYVHRTEVFPDRDDDYSPFTCYGESKVETERSVRASGLEIPWVIIRPTSIWGPWFRIPYRAFFNAVQRGNYLHPKAIKIVKSYRYVGNIVSQIRRFCSVEASKIDRRTLYVSDVRSMEILEFAQEIQKAFGAPPVREAPVTLLRAIAFAGDVLKGVGMKNPPLTSFRLGNLLTGMNYDMSSTLEVAGPDPYSLKDGVEATVEWILNHG